MSNKDVLLNKLYREHFPKNFTVKDLDNLMKYCGCTKFNGGRGSSIGYYHNTTGHILQFDGPHPQKELYRYQIQKVKDFLLATGETKNEKKRHEI